MKIAVGGMIASGKSTLVEALSEELKMPAMYEFADDDVVFNTILRWLYEGVDNVQMLLQFYFLHKHWTSQKEFKDDVIVDKHIIENLIFAEYHLKGLEQTVLYQDIFNAYLYKTKQPELYIILDMNWNTFKERITKRGRQQEIENFDKNKEYFQYLIDAYIPRLTEMCDIVGIDYVIIDTNNKTEQEVLEESLEAINNYLVK